MRHLDNYKTVFEFVQRNPGCSSFDIIKSGEVPLTVNFVSSVLSVLFANRKVTRVKEYNYFRYTAAVDEVGVIRTGVKIRDMHPPEPTARVHRETIASTKPIPPSRVPVLPTEVLPVALEPEPAIVPSIFTPDEKKPMITFPVGNNIYHWSIPESKEIYLALKEIFG